MAQTPDVWADRLDAAATDLQRTALLEQNPSAATADLIRVCMERALDRARKSDYEAALRSSALAVAVASVLKDNAAAARAWRSIAMSQYRLGRYAESVESGERALEQARATTDKKLQADVLRTIGMGYRGLSQFHEALDMDARTLEIVRELKDTTGEAAILIGMANSYARLGSMRKAAECLEQCLRLGEATSDQRAIWVSQENLGNIYVMQGDIPLALRYLEQALKNKIGRADKSDIGNTYVNLIQAYRRAGRLPEALTAAQQGLDLYREVGDQPGVAYVFLNRSEVYRLQHRYAEALTDLRAGLAIHEKNQARVEIASTLAAIAKVELDLGHNEAALDSAQRGASIARAVSSREVLWDALAAAGAAAERLRRPNDARAAYTEAIAAVDDLRKELAGGEQQGLEFLRDKMNLFHGLVSVDLQTGAPEDALGAAERGKSGLILDVLRTGHAGIDKAMTSDEKQRERALSARLSALHASPKRDSAAVAKAASELDAYRAELYAAHPELKVRRGESEPLSFAAAAALLPDRQTALLEFAVAPEATYLFVIAPGPTGKPVLQAHKLRIRQETLQRDVEAFRLQLATRDGGYRETAAALYRLLLGPASAQLRDKRLVAIVPDGPLWGLPFQALVQPNGRHLVEDQAVFYAPSLTVLLETVRARQAATTGSPTILAMGDPDPAAPLPNAAHEVAALAKLYGESSLALTGPAASEAAWKARAPHYRILHLATHGYLDSANPLYSYVALRGGGGEDGMVEAHEILDLDLHADLAVLSACESGRGGFHDGEGVVGLSWALMVAGAPATIVSQWSVDSASTSELMLALHTGLRAGGLAGKAAALRGAALQLLRGPAYRHPYYWAGFVLIGDGY